MVEPETVESAGEYYIIHCSAWIIVLELGLCFLLFLACKVWDGQIYVVGSSVRVVLILTVLISLTAV